MPLDIKLEVEQLRTKYQNDPLQGKTNILLTGESGTGKSYLLSTAPFPVHVDSFDPGGTQGLRTFINSGDIVADTAYEDEDPMKPTAFKLWKETFSRRLKSGYFNHFSTYCLDSATTWCDAILNYIQFKRGAPASIPEWNKDYHPQKVEIRNCLREVLNLPCHVLITGHLEPQKDGEGNIVARRFIMVGKGAVTIPLLFSETWVTEVRGSGDKAEYFIRTSSSGMYQAKSRLSAGGILSAREPANLREIFKKSGLNYEDKAKI